MTFTRQQILDTMAEVVAGREDYVYESEHRSCAYAEADGSPSCLVGHVVARLDPAMFEQFRKAETRWGGFFIEESGDSDGSSAQCPHFDAEPGAISALQAAQCLQDDGNTWGEALDAAWRATDE